MKYALSDFTSGIEVILRDPMMRCVTVFCRPKNPKTERGRGSRSNSQKNFLSITFGKPNYEERDFLKLCKKAKTNPKKMWFKYFKKHGR